jgi:hypothetical protein
VQAQAALVDSFEASLLGGQTVTPTTTQGSGTSGTAVPAGVAAVSTTTPLQQLLAADLLVSALSSLLKSEDVYLVTVHALESGGSSLTKSNSIFGSRSYFSGGSVATYSIFKNDAKFICSCLSYAYRGFIQAKDMGTAAAAPAPLPGVDVQPRAVASDGSGSLLPGVEHFMSTCPP